MVDTTHGAAAAGQGQDPLTDKTDVSLAEEARDRSSIATVIDLWPYIWPSERADLKLRVIVSIVLLIIAKIITVLTPFAYKWAVDALSGEGAAQAAEPPGWLALLAAPLFLVVAYNVGRILMVVFNQLRDALFASVGQYAVRSLGSRTFAHLHRLSLRFHLERRTGGLSRVVERGTKGIETIVRYTILATIPTAVEFLLAAVVIGWHFDLRYVAILLITIIGYLVLTVQMTNWRIEIRREMNDSDTDANSKAIDSLLNFETVKYFNNERMESARFDRSMKRYERAATRTWESLAWLNSAQTVIFSLGMMACMILAAMEVQAGTLTVGDFVLINALLIQLYMPLNFIGMVYREIRQSLVDIEAMFTLLDKDPEIADRPGAPPLHVTEGRIIFEDVRFAYDPERQILKGISFEVPPGKTVALVGPSGAGKSTISRILFRFYDVTGGRVAIDGQDLNAVSQDSLRRALGMVPQDTVLFNDTIRYNIRYGRTDATDDEVEEAARLSQIDGFIRDLPDGYDTMVGERGLKLSGGEKQRVAIARTILKAPPILVLDEATSALDTHTEREIQSALDQVSRDRTTIVIAHRLSTVVNADEILVLSKGEICERGTHDALLARDGVYAGMWQRQREAAQAAEQLRAAVEGDDQGYLDVGLRTR
ncbi:MAG: ABC transporter ATP-binding protein/permease [Pseudomonadota bacterium]